MASDTNIPHVDFKAMERKLHDVDYLAQDMYVVLKGSILLNVTKSLQQPNISMLVNPPPQQLP